MRTFTCIHVNRLNGLRFLADVCTKLQKCTIFGNLRTITQEETWKLDKWFHLSSTLWVLTFKNIPICIWRKSKFIFIWSLLWFILIWKILDFWTKATDSNSHHTFLESRHPEDTRELYAALSLRKAENHNLWCLAHELLSLVPNGSDSLTHFWQAFGTPWKQRFSGVFRGSKMGTLARNGLTLFMVLAFNTFARTVA